MDAYLEEELFDLITFCIENSTSPAAIEPKRKRMQEIGRELYNDGGADAMENMFFAVQNRIKEEIQGDIGPYKSWWNGITDEWKY